MPCSFGIRAVVAAVACSLCLTGFAADGAKKDRDPAKFFQKKDANGDGFLTLEEFKAGMPEKAAEKAGGRFVKLDTNGDDKVSLDEFKTGMDRQPKPKKKQ